MTLFPFQPSLALLVLVACGGEAPAPAITITAASSLTDVVNDAVALWNQSHAGRARASFAASSTIARQIENGAPFDLVLLADESWMDHLVAGEHVDRSSRRAVALGALVVVEHAADERVAGADLLAGRLPSGLDGLRWTTADPAHVPLGRYAAAALRSLGWWDSLEADLVPAASARAALRLVERGEVRWGIVYHTDAAASERVTVLMDIEAARHAPIVYSAALAPGAPPDVQAFLDGLSGAEGRALFAQRGFATPVTEAGR